MAKKKEKKKECKPKVQTLGGGCDKTDPNDPHYGQAGDYDKDCNWIPSVLTNG